MNSFNIIINGAFGRMGSIACEYLAQFDNFSIVAKLGRQDNLEENLVRYRPDLILDLTCPECVYQNCLLYIKHQIRFVIGATGLKSDEVDNIRQQCQSQQLGGIIAPNFSIGSLLAIQFAKKAAKWFDGVDIIEMHHHLKVDSPSGTAIYAAEQIHQGKALWPEMKHESQPGRDLFVHNIPIHAVRMPGILAQQQILLGQIGETLSFQHQIIDRKAYMPGLKLACEKVMEIDDLNYSLERWLLDE
jgi:4-hydroxy-tetrahydrodipicolinate reductase